MLTSVHKFFRVAGVLLLAAVLVVFFAGFLLANDFSVAVGFWSWTSAPHPVSTLLFLAFLAGALLTVIVFCLMVMRLVMQNRSLTRKLKRRDAELQKLRVGALRGLSS